MIIQYLIPDVIGLVSGASNTGASFSNRSENSDEENNNSDNNNNSDEDEENLPCVNSDSETETDLLLNSSTNINTNTYLKRWQISNTILNANAYTEKSTSLR